MRHNEIFNNQFVFIDRINFYKKRTRKRALHARISHSTVCNTTVSKNPVKIFRRQMQNYATLCDKFIQHYVVRGDISPHFRRLIAVNNRFCGDKLIGIQCCIIVYNMLRYTTCRR